MAVYLTHCIPDLKGGGGEAGVSKAVSVCVRSHMCGRTRDMSVAVNCVIVLQQAAATKEPGSSLYHDC